MSSFESVLAQYEKNKQAASGNANKVSSEDRLKKYFTTVLPKNERTGEKRIRILPTKDGSSPFVEVYFHEIQVDGNWLKIYDPAQENGRSPLNEVAQALKMTGVESDKELAKQYRSRKFYIVKVIDRDNEQDGVKFWRFKDNYKGEGIFDKIFPIFKNKGDILDPENGRDLIISLGLTKANNGREYTTVVSVIPEDKGPLHEDKAIQESWLNDELVWSDVYSKKPVEYLEMIARGETPKWDRDAKKWVSNESSDETFGGTSAGSMVDEITDPQIDEEASDELPF